MEPQLFKDPPPLTEKEFDDALMATDFFANIRASEEELQYVVQQWEDPRVQESARALHADTKSFAESLCAESSKFKWSHMRGKYLIILVNGLAAASRGAQDAFPPRYRALSMASRRQLFTSTVYIGLRDARCDPRNLLRLLALCRTLGLPAMMEVNRRFDAHVGMAYGVLADQTLDRQTLEQLLSPCRKFVWSQLPPATKDRLRDLASQEGQGKRASHMQNELNEVICRLVGKRAGFTKPLNTMARALEGQLNILTKACANTLTYEHDTTRRPARRRLTSITIGSCPYSRDG